MSPMLLLISVVLFKEYEAFRWIVCAVVAFMTVHGFRLVTGFGMDAKEERQPSS